MVFGRDGDYRNSLPQSTWLDRSTGDALWLYECDKGVFFEVGIPAEESQEERERYLEIPGPGRGEHHDILRQFLGSDWTGDEALRRHVGVAYSGSIGRWMRDVGNEGDVGAFRVFQDAQIARLAEEFLRESGVERISGSA